eukprot:jgi/Botrbrau1/23654/Bobra.55_2s0037.1
MAHMSMHACAGQSRAIKIYCLLGNVSLLVRGRRCSNHCWTNAVGPSLYIIIYMLGSVDVAVQSSPIQPSKSPYDNITLITCQTTGLNNLARRSIVSMDI